MIANPPPRKEAGQGNAKLVGKRIANTRQIKGMTVPALAEAANISKGYLWQLENGEDPNPSVSVLTQIANALDTTVAELLGQPAVKARATPLPDTLPPGLKEFLDEQKRRGEPIREDIARALAQLRARGGPKDWAFLYEVIKRNTRSENA